MQQSFPVLASGTVAYFDHAATTQMPLVVIEAIEATMRAGRANPWRGLYPLAEQATTELERAREVVARFFGAAVDRVVFTSGATEGLNAVAFGLEYMVAPRDVIVVTQAEHHSNLLPWRELARRTGAHIMTVPVLADGTLDVKAFDDAMGYHPKIVAMTHVSNVTGTCFPIASLATKAKEIGAIVVVDAAQSAAHVPLDIEVLQIDALAVSAHKMYGPMCVGALVLSPRLSTTLLPMHFGGGMVDEVSVEGWKLAPIPRRFEAGTRNVEGIVGFAAALEWLSGIGWAEIRRHEDTVLQKLDAGLRELPGVTVHGPRERVGVTSISIAGCHPHDVAEALGERGVCVRAGHHCASLMTSALDARGTVRLSIGLGNTEKDIETCLTVLREIIV